jgi:hypothetical protein
MSSIRVMARGVNARLTSLRIRSCSGGSIVMIIGAWAAALSGSVSWSSVRPCVLVKVFQSRCAATTSSNRDSAQKPMRSLW